MNDLIRLLASWALVHESADEAWKAAVARGEAHEPGAPNGGPDAFVDGLAAMVAAEKERLKEELARDGRQEAAAASDLSEALHALRFELAELRGRVETLQASIDALAGRESDGGS